MAFVAPILPYLMAAGAAVSAYGVIQQGRAANREANYQAGVDDNNAISSGYAAVQEQQNAAREAGSIRDDGRRALSSQRSAAANAGLMISGSVLDVMGDTAIESEKEAHMALYRGDINAYNQRNQGANYRNQAVLTRMSGANAKKASKLTAASTLLTGAANAGLSYAQIRK